MQTCRKLLTLVEENPDTLLSRRVTITNLRKAKWKAFLAYTEGLQANYGEYARIFETCRQALGDLGMKWPLEHSISQTYMAICMLSQCHMWYRTKGGKRPPKLDPVLDSEERVNVLWHIYSTISVIGLINTIYREDAIVAQLRKTALALKYPEKYTRDLLEFCFVVATTTKWVLPRWKNHFLEEGMKLLEENGEKGDHVYMCLVYFQMYGPHELVLSRFDKFERYV
jgi:hypothetical protein